MDKNHANPSIGCSVDQCRYHCKDKAYCSLDNITVNTTDSHGTTKDCTQCYSFKKD